MITNRLDSNLFSGNLDSSGVKTKNNSDLLSTEKKNDPANSPTIINRPVEGMYNLAPLDRYKFILDQAGPGLRFSTNQSNPEKTIRQANEIINKAILPPTSDNPGNIELTKAIQIKRIAESRLDIAV